MDTQVNTQFSVQITIPAVPPSVNHYKKPVTYRTQTGIRKGFALTPEAILFRDLVWIEARNQQSIIPSTKAERDAVRYGLYITVYLAVGQRGDGDNFWKCIADSLVHAKVIHSDARVRRWHLDVEDCDRGNPRTEIQATRIERRLK